ncbi:hypothetical protein K432DRAFT_152588 [Lepidopterella palustris CBS 459.81]|uniref:Uncharacterized protein n=1 Tax=Lepidopterella palustris CBS 459.81 TaxID=1314670 RepID=A0A8E2EHQ3_9PEZI|nr:hypothetical protein K432DRAFT_152588 [Lepidopterella palustris CBS 459.81]
MKFQHPPLICPSPPHKYLHSICLVLSLLGISTITHPITLPTVPSTTPVVPIHDHKYTPLNRPHKSVPGSIPSCILIFLSSDWNFKWSISLSRGRCMPSSGAEIGQTRPGWRRLRRWMSLVDIRSTK